MKKLFILAAVVVALGLTSCSKSAKDYINEQKELTEQLQQATADGDTAKADEITKKMEELGKEVEKRMKEDPEFAKEMFGEAMTMLQEQGANF